MTFVDLFAGIGGIALGLERAGHECVGFVEIDPYCQRVLHKHWPEVPKHADVRTFHGTEFGPTDILAGGFPCQDISHAGRRAGLEGQHSGLWTDFARIIRNARPKYVLVENTTGLLVRGLERVLADLAESGYDAEWDCIPAAAVGAPHLRARTWLLAYPRGQRNAADDTVFAGQPLPDVRDWWAPAPDVRRVDDGPPYVLDSAQRLRALGNSAVPQVAEMIGRRLA